MAHDAPILMFMLVVRFYISFRNGLKTTCYLVFTTGCRGKKTPRINGFWNNPCEVYDISTLFDHFPRGSFQWRKRKEKRKKALPSKRPGMGGILSHSLSVNYVDGGVKRKSNIKCSMEEALHPTMLFEAECLGLAAKWCSEVVQGVVEDVRDPRWRRDLVGELDMLQHECGRLK
jgi:hypothetical protein